MTFFMSKRPMAGEELLCRSAATGLASVVTTEPMPKGGIGYGGGIFHVRGSCLVYAAEDGRLHQVDLQNPSTGHHAPC